MLGRYGEGGVRKLTEITGDGAVRRALARFS
jgi:hypothetical protein